MSTKKEKMFGELRATLQQTPSVETWDLLAAHLDKWSVDDYFNDMVVPYVTEYLAKWPDDVVRAAPAKWGKQIAKGQDVPKMQFANGLNMRKSKCGPKTLEKLLKSPILETLIWLDLSENGLKNDGGVALGKCTHLKNLKTLILESCKIGNRGSMAIANAKHFNQLTTLDLTKNDLHHEGCGAIENSKHLHKSIRDKAWDWFSYEREERESSYWNGWE